MRRSTPRSRQLSTSPHPQPFPIEEKGDEEPYAAAFLRSRASRRSRRQNRVFSGSG
jgi:hypothetical protein